ncbi:MAG: Ig-like domain-containing protein [candidate division WOR-3 bacterium]
MKVLVETSPGLDKLKSFQDFFKSFVCANYIKTGVDGYEEGADYPEVHIEQRYNTVPPNNNQHYANRPPDNIGSPVPWEEGNFPNGSPIWLPHLACHYIRVVKPVQIDDRTMLYFNFEGDGEKLIWAVPFVKVKVNGTKEKGEIILANNKAYNYPIPIGGSDPNDIAEIIFIPTNLDTSGAEIQYRYSFAIVPVFQKSYQENPQNGSTREVLNLDTDNWYKPKEKVRLKVDLSDKVHIGNNSTLTVDFSQVDKAFDPAKVSIIEVDGVKHEYQIEYELSNTLETPNQLLPVIIRVKDLTNDPTHQSKETIFQLRVEGPPVVESTDPQAGTHDVDIYQKIKVVFNKAMDTVSVREAMEVKNKDRDSDVEIKEITWDNDMKTMEVRCDDPVGKYEL